MAITSTYVLQSSVHKSGNSHCCLKNKVYTRTKGDSFRTPLSTYMKSNTCMQRKVGERFFHAKASGPARV